MSWTDQKPEATDVLLAGRAVTNKGIEVHFEIDRVPGGDVAKFRVTVGNLFGSKEVCRLSNLEDALRAFQLVLDQK